MLNKVLRCETGNIMFTMENATYCKIGYAISIEKPKNAIPMLGDSYAVPGLDKHSYSKACRTHHKQNKTMMEVL